MIAWMSSCQRAKSAAQSSREPFSVQDSTRQSRSTIVKTGAARIEPDRIRFQGAHRIDQDSMQVGAVDHEIGRAVARDRLAAEVEQLPGLARIPEPDFLAGRLAPGGADLLFKAQR